MFALPKTVKKYKMYLFRLAWSSLSWCYRRYHCLLHV